MLEKIRENKEFKDITDFLKNIGWWITTTLGFAFFFRDFFAQQTNTVLLLLGLLLAYVSIRAHVYRKRYSTICGSFSHIYHLNLEFQHRLGNELSHLSKTSESSISSMDDETREKATLHELHDLLQEILNRAQRAFRDAIGSECTAVLLMPESSEEDGHHFIGRIYSSNASNDRVRTRSPHKGGLVEVAFRTDGALYYPNLKSELEKGNFRKNRKNDQNPFAWYKSTVLCRVTVMDQPWAVLCIDSPREDAFRHDITKLLPIFATACSIAFSIAEHGDLGNKIYVES